MSEALAGKGWLSMADPRGFLKSGRQVAERRPVDERVKDWNEVYPGSAGRALLPIITEQAGRCMDCGIPFCHQGCPLGNIIPEWNDLVWRDDWEGAIERLHATNNFPEFTGRLCPAPCEAACVLGINQDPVTIKNVEVSIIDKAWESGLVRPQPPEWLSGRTVAVVGSGPAGLAAAQQLTRAGHTVAVYERADKIGGLLRYGIPEFKMEKQHLDRRLEQMRREGTVFRAGVDVGAELTGDRLRERYDAVVLAMGATAARDLPATGREAGGIHQAMEFLPQANRVALGEAPTQDGSGQITATGKNVVIIGGGDTGADCLGTSTRQGAASITQLEIMPEPPESRPAGQPWPSYPMIFRVSSAHEEAGDRVYGVSTKEFLADEHGNVRALRLVDVEFEAGKFTEVEGSEREIPAELVLLAMGFTGPEKDGLVDQLGVDLDERGNVARDASYMSSVDGVFVAGDAGRGQSLIVWAIAEGRAAASAVDRYLTGSTTLPAPIPPTERPLVV
jgi:glutamate synthase (NADPH/NADH) small chain